jgi:hypothetical protein
MNNFVLRKKGTNNCITSDKNNNVILRDCDESLLQRPMMTVFQGGSLTGTGAPGNLHTIMTNPKNKNTARDKYSGTLPYDAFIEDIKNDILAISPDTTGASLRYETIRSSDVKNFALKDNRLTINRNGTEARIADDNVITNKFKNNKYSSDVINAVKTGVAATPAAIGMAAGGKWKEFIDTVIYNNPAVQYIKNTFTKITTPNYTYNYPSELAEIYTAKIRTTNDEFKLLFKNFDRTNLLTYIFYLSEYRITGDLYTMLPSLNAVQFNIATDTIALIDTSPNKNENFIMQGLFNIRYIDATRFVLTRVGDDIMKTKILYVKITHGQFANETYKFFLLNKQIFAEKNNFTVSSADSDIYNYQEDPEIGNLYNRDLPVPKYNFADANGRFLRAANPAPNEAHNYYSKCAVNNKYCFNSCYGRPDTECATENPDLLFNYDINYYYKYYPEFNAFDNRGNRELTTAYQKYIFNTQFQRSPLLSGVTQSANNIKSSFDDSYVQRIQSMHRRLEEIIINYRSHVVFAPGSPGLVFNNTAAEHGYISFLLNQYSRAVYSAMKVNLAEWQGPNFNLYRNILYSFTISYPRSNAVFTLPTNTADFIKEFPALFNLITHANAINSIMTKHYAMSPNFKALEFAEVKAVYDTVEKTSTLVANVAAELKTISDRVINRRGSAYMVSFKTAYPITSQGFLINGDSFYRRGSYLQPTEFIWHISQGRTTTDQTIYTNFINNGSTAIVPEPKITVADYQIPTFANTFPSI